MTILEDLKKRGVFKQISNEDKLNSLDPSKVRVYCGFDPTAKSLHLGNYVLICNLKRFEQYGFKPLAVLGGATGMIGDPSFRDSERVLLSNQQVIENKKAIKKQLESFGLEVFDNYDIYKNMSIIDFLRDAGKLTNISYMLAKDSVQSRIERGLSFTEFAYQIIQGYDFLKLYKDKNVNVQIGGSDQWGNIVTGLDMIQKIEGDKHKAVILTLDLLTDSNGKKIGKSFGGGGLWLDKTMNSPFNMYQFLVNLPDTLVEKFLKWLTFLPLDEIDEIIKTHEDNPSEHYAQKIIAKEIVKDLFGEKELEIAIKITSFLFDKDFDFTNLTLDNLKQMSNYLPTVSLNKKKNIVDQLIEQKVFQSKREAREFINNKSLKIDGISIEENEEFEPKNFDKKYAILKKGKKQTYIIKVA
ncbi:tyrosine--tRNA ligase [Mycoplasma sp. Mirounga ES2805-ORL]|uniref:tyrosine--tRNA ligase n=1 Tax=Mycoplasma sp. Mirounga ES2805-ORL TaxID=754514 RepID=UPI0035302B13